MGAEFARRTNRKHEQENEPINSRQGKEREVLLHKILGVAHFVSVAEYTLPKLPLANLNALNWRDLTKDKIRSK
jgi:hypothetical protein